jgi:hypothetical protein
MSSAEPIAKPAVHSEALKSVRANEFLGSKKKYQAKIAERAVARAPCRQPASSVAAAIAG